MAPPKKCAADLFSEHALPEPNSGCWLWTGTLSSKGYGLIQRSDFSGRAHRYSYLTFRGPIPDGLLVCHRCDVPCCVNPAHLFVGTVQDNTVDCVRKGRHVSPPALRTHCPQGHEYTSANTYYSHTRQARSCRECERQKYQRKKARVTANRKMMETKWN